MASRTSWPLREFLSSAVKTGMPLRKSARSRLCSSCSLKRSWRTTAKRLAACRRCSSSLRPLAGRKYASRNLQPESLTPLRSTSRAPRRAISRERRPRKRGFRSAPWCCSSFFHCLGWVARRKSTTLVGMQAEGAVVVVRPASVVAARRRVVAEGRGRLSHRRRVARACVGATAQQRAFDGRLESPFGDVGSHGMVTRGRASADLFERVVSSPDFDVEARNAPAEFTPIPRNRPDRRPRAPTGAISMAIIAEDAFAPHRPVLLDVDDSLEPG